MKALLGFLLALSGCGVAGAVTTAPPTITATVTQTAYVPTFTLPAVVMASVPTTTMPPYTCADALAYLRAHASPDFTLICPGWTNDGAQAMTCMNVPGVCHGRVISIRVPCPASVMNEAANSWTLEYRLDRPIDPYGHC